MKTVLIAALSADGFIAHDASQLSTDWTTDADRKLFVRVTKELGTIVMGRTTFETIGRALPGRRMIVYTTHPERITAEGIETTSEAPGELLKRLQAEGATGIAICGGAQIYTMFMRERLIDELYLTVIPILLGTGVTLFNETTSQPLTLIEPKELGDGAVLLHYRAQPRP